MNVDHHHIQWRRSYSAHRRTCVASPFEVFAACLSICVGVGIFIYAVLGMFGVGQP